MSDQDQLFTQQRPDVYLTLAGTVDQEMAKRAFQALAVVTQQREPRVHLLLQTGGGSINDGICLYNLIRNLPVPVWTYNMGCVGSSGVMIFLGGRQRFASNNATFMIHKPSTGNIGGIGADLLESITESLAIDEARTLEVLTAGVKLPTKIIKAYNKRDIHITAVDALSYGIIHEVKDFTPPLGTQVYNI